MDYRSGVKWSLGDQKSFHFGSKCICKLLGINQDIYLLSNLFRLPSWEINPFTLIRSPKSTYKKLLHPVFLECPPDMETCVEDLVGFPMLLPTLINGSNYNTMISNEKCGKIGKPICDHSL